MLTNSQGNGNPLIQNRLNTMKNIHKVIKELQEELEIKSLQLQLIQLHSKKIEYVLISKDKKSLQEAINNLIINNK